MARGVSAITGTPQTNKNTTQARAGAVFEKHVKRVAMKTIADLMNSNSAHVSADLATTYSPAS
jgi:hypothetical protein